jgi:hypothetical protein
MQVAAFTVDTDEKRDMCVRFLDLRGDHQAFKGKMPLVGRINDYEDFSTCCPSCHGRLLGFTLLWVSEATYPKAMARNLDLDQAGSGLTVSCLFGQRPATEFPPPVDDVAEQLGGLFSIVAGRVRLLVAEVDAGTFAGP